MLKVFWGCYSFLILILKEVFWLLVTKWVLTVTFLNLILSLLLLFAFSYV